MSYVKPPVGSEVEITVRGVVEEPGDVFLRLASGVVMKFIGSEAAASLNVRVIPPSFGMGDVVRWTDGDSHKTLFYMALPGRASGWYDQRGLQVYPELPDCTLIARADGSAVLPLVKES